MLEPRELQSLVDAAEEAARAGEYPSAEQLLREVAFLQEASLGPLHPDLANTLNNLGIVCEMTGKPDEAERSFRRACTIAATALEPEHPFVATSRKNLEDFCRARGKPIDQPTAPSAPPAADAAERVPRVERPPRASPPRSSQPAAARSWSRPVVIGGLIAGGLLGAWLAMLMSPRANGDIDSVQQSPTVRPLSTPESTTEPPTVAPSPTEVPKGPAAASIEGVNAGEEATLRPPTPLAESQAPASAPAGVESEAPVVSPAGPPLVAEGRMCRTLSTSGSPAASATGGWSCQPPSLPVGPGSLFFYTRVKSTADTTVQHRWYRDERLRQVVELAIRANTASGYRTYSRHTIGDDATGEWRVELRTRTGVVLHQERFVVR